MNEQYRIRNNSDDISSSRSYSNNSNIDDNNDDNNAIIQQHQSPTIRNNITTNKTETNISGLVGALLAALTTGGTTYAFGLYGNALKHSLHLTQSELDTISSGTFCAGFFSFIPGMITDGYGPRFALTLGGVLGCVNLTLYWCVATSFIVVSQSIVVPTLTLLGFMTFVSAALVTGSVFKVIVTSCGPGTKGSAVGCAKGYVGLGAGVYACIFQSFRSSSSVTSDLNFLLMAAFFAVFAVSIPGLYLIPSKLKLASKKLIDTSGSLHYRIIYAGLASLAFIVISNSLLELKDANEEMIAEQGGHSDDTIVVVSDVEYEEQLSESNDYSAYIDGGEGGDGDELNSILGGGEPPVKPPVNPNSGDDGQRNLFMVFLVVILWFGPILSLLCLPKATHTVLPTSDDQENDDDGGVNNNDDSNEEEVIFSDSATERRKLNNALNPITSSARGGVELTTKQQDKNRNDDSNNQEDYVVGEEEFEEYHDEPLEDVDEELVVDFAVNDTDNAVDDDINIYEPPAPSTDKNLWQMLSTPEAWFLLWTFMILGGAGTIITNNMGQMVEALHLEPIIASASLSLFSVAQSASRVITGAISESALEWNINLFGLYKRRGVPRPTFLIVASLGSFIAHTVLINATTEIIFVFGVTLSGVAFGMIWPLLVLIIGECFGTNHVGANYMFYDGAASALGTMLLSKFVAQEVYEDHIVHTHNNSTSDNSSNSHNEDDNLTCFGTDCFGLSHAIVAGLSLSCVFSSIAALCQTAHVYRKRS